MTAGGREFQVAGAAQLKDLNIKKRLPVITGGKLT